VNALSAYVRDVTRPSECLTNSANRPSGDRTAPYWRHIMVIDVYAAMAHGVWLYEPRRHAGGRQRLFL